MVASLGLQRLKMEVDLELSVGGSFRNLETSKLNIDSDLEPCSCSRSDDVTVKREIQARRRQEAKKKREEKKKGMKNGGAGDDERTRLEKQRLQSRVKDRERRENDEADLTRHKSNVDHRSHGMVEDSIQMLMPIQYVYPHRVRSVPLAFPCVVPCWAAATRIQPVKSLPVRQGCGAGSVLSGGWTNSFASVSPQDGGSSDHQSSDARAQSENSVSSYQKESSQRTSSERSTSCSEKVSTPEKDRISIGESISSSQKEAGERNGDSGKQPKPQNQNQPPSPNSLEQMPYVSATGNGPNGKTITGFLYRYTKTEVSIVCVCHGSSFTPAGFVQHAGGVDVSQPLRHITVIPSAFA